MNATSTRGRDNYHWMRWTGVIAGAMALLAIGLRAGVPMTGWRGTLSAVVFAAIYTMALAFFLTRGDKL